MEISYDDFAEIDIRVGTVSRVEPHTGARKPAFTLWIDFGHEVGEKKSSAQITEHYAIESLLGRQVAAVVNFRPSRSAPSCRNAWSSASPTPPAGWS